jgi:hypothetical protein
VPVFSILEQKELMTMRFMMMNKPGRDVDGPPSPKEEKTLGQLIREAEAVVPIGDEGLQPNSKGTRVRISGKKFIIDGPFAETKELIASNAIVQANSKQEAIEWIQPF